MKQSILYTQSDPGVADFIRIWKQKKNYPAEPILTVGHCLELLIATSYNFHTEFSDGRFFNKILINPESVVAWEGDELIDILFYEVQTSIKKRLNKAHMFSEEVSQPQS